MINPTNGRNVYYAYLDDLVDTASTENFSLIGVPNSKIEEKIQEQRRKFLERKTKQRGKK